MRSGGEWRGPTSVHRPRADHQRGADLSGATSVHGGGATDRGLCTCGMVSKTSGSGPRNCVSTRERATRALKRPIAAGSWPVTFGPRR